MRRSFPYAATFATLICMGILCALGTWQLQRLEWKTRLINQLNVEYAKDAAKSFITPAQILAYEGYYIQDDQDQEKFSPPDFVRGALRGVYDYGAEILLGPRWYENLPGFDVLTPLKLANGEYVLVNRGWVPHEWTPAQDEGKQRAVTVIGLLRKPDAANSFMRGNDPQKNQWTSIDFAQIAAAKKLKISGPYVLYAEGNASNGEYPLPQSHKPDLPNNHLQYALFWFSMAGVLLIVYVFRFLRK